jgi:hypothetical protein
LPEDKQTSKHGGRGRYNEILEFKGEQIKKLMRKKTKLKKIRKRKKEEKSEYKEKMRKRKKEYKKSEYKEKMRKEKNMSMYDLKIK